MINKRFFIVKFFKVSNQQTTTTTTKPVSQPVDQQQKTTTNVSTSQITTTTTKNPNPTAMNSSNNVATTAEAATTPTPTPTTSNNNPTNTTTQQVTMSSHVGLLDNADHSLRVRKHLQKNAMLHRRHNSSCNLPVERFPTQIGSCSGGPGSMSMNSSGNRTPVNQQTSTTTTTNSGRNLSPSSSHTCCHHHTRNSINNRAYQQQRAARITINNADESTSPQSSECPSPSILRAENSKQDNNFLKIPTNTFNSNTSNLFFAYIVINFRK